MDVFDPAEPLYCSASSQTFHCFCEHVLHLRAAVQICCSAVFKVTYAVSLIITLRCVKWVVSAISVHFSSFYLRHLQKRNIIGEVAHDETEVARDLFYPNFDVRPSGTAFIGKEKNI